VRQARREVLQATRVEPALVAAPMDLDARAVELLLDAGAPAERGERARGGLRGLREHRTERTKVDEARLRQRPPAARDDACRDGRQVALEEMRAGDRRAVAA